MEVERTDGNLVLPRATWPIARSRLRLLLEDSDRATNPVATRRRYPRKQTHNTGLADRIASTCPSQTSHCVALSSFFERTGAVQSWPSPLPDGTILAAKAKEIYKPVGSRYALTIRQSLQSQYPEREPVVGSDGSWSNFYFQENLDTSARDAQFTNRGLVECWRDKGPVAMMRQVSDKPTSSYKILGLALVAGWGEGYFIFDGFQTDGRSERNEMDFRARGLQKQARRCRRTVEESNVFMPLGIASSEKQVPRFVVNVSS
jgi:hypothetical protein